MATGGLDANGIWLYGEDDSEPTASALLNKLGNSISDVFDGGLPVANGGTGATTVAGAQDSLRVGLVNVIPPTIRVSGGSATANTLGKISFTAATSIGLDNIFSANYSTYKIFVELNAVSTGSTSYIRFTTAGAATTSSSLYGGSTYINVHNTGAWSYSNGAADIPIMQSLAVGYSALSTSSEITVTKTSQGVRLINHASGFPLNYAGYISGAYLWNQENSAIDGIKIFPSGGNFTGTIQVLGVNY